MQAFHLTVSFCTSQVDIRQWVLMTNTNPLTIYFFNEGYVRFCASDYALTDLSDR